MCKFDKKNDSRRIDPCMKNLIDLLNAKGGRIKTLACCCGHGKYPMTIISSINKFHIWDVVSGESIPRKKKFYKKDKQGYYYIPEVLK